MADQIYYFDHNATTPIEPRVLEQTLPFLAEHFGNPSSDHPLGRVAASALATARAQIAGLIGCRSEEVVFTSGGTEANNLAIRGIAARFPELRRIVTTVVEHPATVQPCRFLESQGWEVVGIPVDSQGRVEVEALNKALDRRTALVTVMHANNETGALMPLADIASVCRDRGIPLHTDAAQSVGKVTTRVDELGVDLLSIAGHKIYAPKGVGALYVRGGIELEPVLQGAGQERGLRPGTENVAGIVALGAACELAQHELQAEGRRLLDMKTELWQSLSSQIPGLKLNGHPTECLPNTLSVAFPGVHGRALLACCDEVVASTGAACHASGEEVPSVVLTAMGIDPRQALGTVRLTLGRLNSPEQIGPASEALIRAYRRLASG